MGTVTDTRGGKRHNGAGGDGGDRDSGGVSRPADFDPNLLQNIFGTPSANVDPDVLRSIFGTDEGESGYSGIDVSVEDRGTMNVLRQLAEAEEQSVDVEQLPKYEHCSDYTERFGYGCVPYYQCANGSIITDGEGLLDVRSTLNAEESKCPGPLDVCCKDAEFVPPAQPAVQYQPKCGRRNAGGLSVRIHRFRIPIWRMAPHVCPVEGGASGGGCGPGVPMWSLTARARSALDRRSLCRQVEGGGWHVGGEVRGVGHPGGLRTKTSPGSEGGAGGRPP